MKYSHALSAFRFCPVCGSSHFVENDFKSKKCRDCGFEYYLNSAAAVVGIILDGKGRILVSRRAKEPQKGTLDFPGGFVDSNESLEQALERELLEETGVGMKPQRWLFSLPNHYLFSGVEIPTTDSFFLCSLPPQANLQAHDDVADLIWIPLTELQPELFGMDSMRHAIPRLQQML